jgi:hypothetical protein
LRAGSVRTERSAEAAITNVGKGPVNWTEKEALKWESMALKQCVVGRAYQMRLVLQGIYERKLMEEGRKLFGK